jgi:carbon storage regulator
MRSTPFRNHGRIKEVAMLVLSRKLGERIVIDGGIVITIVKLDRHQVRLGVEAPGATGVWREEILAARRSNSGAIDSRVGAGS